MIEAGCDDCVMQKKAKKSLRVLQEEKKLAQKMVAIPLLCHPCNGEKKVIYHTQLSDLKVFTESITRIIPMLPLAKPTSMR